MDVRELVEHGVRRLEEARLPSGAWGYHRGGQLFVIPTALALLALAPSPGGSGHPALDVLLAAQAPGGFFSALGPEDPEPHSSTSPAALALRAHGRDAAAARAERWLLRWQAPPAPLGKETLENSRAILRIDASLPGWPWFGDEAFATVEPSALACLALRASSEAGARDRIAATLRFLADRECRGGGWNYGNPYFHEDALPPITVPTAVATLAVLVCESPRPSVLAKRGLESLARLLAGNPSRRANAWGAVAFAAAGERERAEAHAGRAVDSGDGRGPWGEGPMETALALLALRAARGDAPRCLGIALA